MHAPNPGDNELLWLEVTRCLSWWPLGNASARVLRPIAVAPLFGCMFLL